MKGVSLAAIAAALAAVWVSGGCGSRASAATSGARPYDYRARQRLVQAHLRTRDHVAAYYEAAWLAWMAPRAYADSPEGTAVLRDRRVRDRAAAASAGGPLWVIVAAADGGRLVAETCLNGAAGQHASRLRQDVADLVSQAEKADWGNGRKDAVTRSALAHLYLSLDDCLRLEDTPSSRRARPHVLKKAASLATAVVSWLPKSPGARRTLAEIRARLADLEDRSELWDLAIAEAEMAQALDPEDPSLVEMVWTLHLRAGHWADASRWETGGPSAHGCDRDVSGM